MSKKHWMTSDFLSTAHAKCKCTLTQFGGLHQLTYGKPAIVPFLGTLSVKN